MVMMMVIKQKVVHNDIGMKETRRKSNPNNNNNNNKGVVKRGKERVAQFRKDHPKLNLKGMDWRGPSLNTRKRQAGRAAEQQ